MPNYWGMMRKFVSERMVLRSKNSNAVMTLQRQIIGRKLGNKKPGFYKEQL